MRQEKIVECPVCKKLFATKKYNQKYCTNQCRNDHFNSQKMEAMMEWRVKRNLPAL